jgi:hypothetical protein
MLNEYFIVTSSFAAPFCSDTDQFFQEGVSPRHVLEKVARQYSHPCGLFAAVCYESADSYHKKEKPLAKWLSNHELSKMEATKGESGYTYRGIAPGKFEVNGKVFTVENPHEGRVVDVE